MYMKEMVIEGFKSYGQRTVIDGFDPEFNAITGLNGSGKSNILDAICFLLGITNLSNVRAGSLQELVYKSGQAGVSKATVTIKFDNRDRNQSPLGYEQYEEISITRQVVIGGRNKYLINGTNVQANRVQDLFRSVQLNVNNPHFLIMQGHITKVINMKPPEILSMIEEAAGTRMYEAKKQQAQRTIEKKESKLKEINDIITEEITPTLQKLKEERGQYLEYQKVQRELEHITKVYVAWKFVSAQEDSEKAEEEFQKVKQEIQKLQQKIKDQEHEVANLEQQIIEMRAKRDQDSGGALETLEKQLKEKEKSEAKIMATQKNVNESIKAEEKKKKQLEKNLNEDRNAVVAKEKELDKLKSSFQKLKEADEADAEALAAAQKKFQAISTGLYSSEDGGAATLQEQLMAAKKEITEAQTETKQSQMRLKHSQEELKKKDQEMKQTATGYQRDKKNLENMEKELKNLENELSKLNYEDGKLEDLERQKRHLNGSIRSMREKLDGMEARFPQLNFNYRDPERNFNRNSVKGLACKLIKVKDPNTTTALEVAAGGRLYNVIVDTETTGKKLLEKGQLQSRVTIIPLNKIASRSIDNGTVRFAQQIVGKENVHTAISLVGYDPDIQAAMEYIFGMTFICTDMDCAKKVTFHDRIMKKSVTLDGDVFDPAGTLTGGSRSKGSSILTHLEQMSGTQSELQSREQEIGKIDHEIRNLGQVAERYNKLKQQLDLRTHEVELVRKRLEQTSHHRFQQEVDALRASVVEMEETLVRCKQVESDGAKKVKDLENKIKDAKTFRERELKAAEEDLKRMKKKSEQSRAQWKDKEQEFETLRLEVSELKAAIEGAENQIKSCEEALQQYVQDAARFKEEAAEAKSAVQQLQKQVKTQKEIINQQNKEIQQSLSRKEKLIKDVEEEKLEIQKMEHRLSELKALARECQSKVAQLLEKYEWIADDRQYFGRPNTAYDFKDTDPQEAGKRMQKLQELRDKLSRSVNTRAMNLLGKAEEQYNDLLRKKRIVENDKSKIEAVIRELDEKKKEALRQAWEQVNKDFGSIFSSLLPGAQTRLQPPEGQDVLDGLEVKVGFGGVWKESLGELSGGQRSLVALSLILAMLLFKPAPIYILDEVDSALDLSHTQNIGNMLKTHFKRSQFILVSLKEGMFNNANVLFQTRFVDGMSTVTRSVQGQSRRQ